MDYYIRAKKTPVLPVALPQKSRDGGEFIFFCKIFLLSRASASGGGGGQSSTIFGRREMLYKHLFSPITPIILYFFSQSIKILGTEVFSRDGRQPEAQEFFNTRAVNGFQTTCTVNCPPDHLTCHSPRITPDRKMRFEMPITWMNALQDDVIVRRFD